MGGGGGVVCMCVCVCVCVCVFSADRTYVTRTHHRSEPPAVTLNLKSLVVALFV